MSKDGSKPSMLCTWWKDVSRTHRVLAEQTFRLNVNVRRTQRVQPNIGPWRHEIYEFRYTSSRAGVSMNRLQNWWEEKRASTRLISWCRVSGKRNATQSVINSSQPT